MGADLCMQWLIWEKDVPLDWGAGDAFLLAKAKENFDPENHEATVEETPVDDGEMYSYLEMKADLDSLKSILKNGSRDCYYLEIKHLCMMCTGGMSWGDSPTDSYDLISRISEVVGLQEAIGFFQYKDYKSILGKVLDVPAVRPMIMGLDDDLDKMIETKEA